jgi:predicted aspartyl protease
MAGFTISRRGLMWASAAGAAGLLAPSAFAQQRKPLPPEPDPTDADIAAWVDNFGRPTAMVSVNGRGPFKFLVDTGATTTVIATRRAEAMGLQPTGVMVVNGTTGIAEVPLAYADELRAGSIKRNRVRVALLERGSMQHWDGVLGADMFIGRRLEFDIARKTVQLTNSASESNRVSSMSFGHGESFTLRNGVLAQLYGTIGKVRSQLIIDTGADCSIANLALSEELRRRHKFLRREPNMTVLGVTGEVLVGEGIQLPLTRLGNVMAKDAAAIAVDAPIFKVWKLESEPAMLVGVDLLSRLSRFSIDYRTRIFDATPMATLISQGNTALG